MRDLIAGYWVSRMIYVAAKLGLADLLKKGARTADDLAATTGVKAPALYRVLRTLASYGVFEEIKGKRFRLTPLGNTLRTDVPASMHGFALMLVEKHVWDAWEQLLHAVQTGELPFDKIFGMPFYQYLEQHPDDLEVFGESMTSLSGTENPAIAAAFKRVRGWSEIRTLVDVAGGLGSLLAMILEANPKINGVLFDLPLVIARAAMRSSPDGTEGGGAMPPRARQLLRISAGGRRRLHPEVHPPQLGRRELGQDSCELPCRDERDGQGARCRSGDLAGQPPRMG